MSKVDCKNCQFYHNGRCEKLGEYTVPGECECFWFAPKAIKKPCVAEIAKNAKQTVFHRITESPEVLAEKLVNSSYIKKKLPLTDIRGRLIGYKSVLRQVWKSSVTEETYSKKAEAIAATVKKLKEVYNG